MKGLKMTLLRAIAFVAASWLPLSGAASAQEAYPSKPVRMIIPFAPGGPADVIARLVAQKLSEELGKQFYVESHAGAGGNTGSGLAARQPADGYSLLVTSQALVINASLYKSLPYDTFKDFAPVTRIATTPNVLVVHPDVPARSVKELVELMRTQPDKYHGYAQPGIGTPSHLSGELFKLSQKLNLTSIPFGGGGPMVQSVIAGHTPIAFSSVPPAAPLIHAGRMRALAVTADKRLESLPDVPTMAEAGFPGQTGETPVGILVPAATPQPVIDLLHRKVVQIVAMPDVRQRLAAIGFSPIGDTPAEFTAFLRSEHDKWAKVINEAGIKLP
jgi:tripartite-type tricarboxylate transporter receptor subunit TctC